MSKGFDNEYYYELLVNSLKMYDASKFTTEQLREALLTLKLIVTLDEIDDRKFKDAREIKPD